VKGNLLPAADGQDQVLEAGENIRREKGGEGEDFFATIDGVLRLTKGRLSAVALLPIHGDVSYTTGNLRFDGEIFVDGSVQQGFSVKAGGDITIVGGVDTDAEITARGNIIIGQGIVGLRTRVVARGNVRAQFIQEAMVMAGKDILLGNYASRARLRGGVR